MGEVEHNRELVHRLVEIVNDRQLERIGEVASGQVAEAAAGWVGPFTRSFPDFRMEVLEVVAEPDKVVGYFKCSGTHRGDWRGHAPTGRAFRDIDEIYIFGVAGGKLDSAIAVVEDDLTRRRQLGLED